MFGFLLLLLAKEKDMTIEEKAIIMKPLYAIAAHYGVKDSTIISFKKRSVLLDKLKEKNEDAYALANEFILSQIKLDRIKNDKEKQMKNSELWNSEMLLAQEEASTSEHNLSEFFTKLN